MASEPSPAEDVAPPAPVPGSAVDLALRATAEHLARAERLLLTCHRGPDGDSVGSMVALASLLRARGKVAVLYNPDAVPRRLQWLPLARGFSRKLGKEATYEATVIVDCAEARLLGDRFPRPEVTGPLIVLDHHSSVVPYGDIYVCDPTAASTGVLVARLFGLLDWPLTQDAAVGIYASLASDTGTFRYANTNAEALRLAAELVEHGVDPWAVSERMYERASVARYKLLGRLFEHIELTHGGKVALMVLSRDLLAAAGASWEDTVDIVSYARALDGVECGVLLSPTKRGDVRVSLRSKGRLIDAGALCATLGGGGHRGAAGCVLSGDMASVRERVLDALAQALASPRARG